MSDRKCCMPNCNKTTSDGTTLHRFPNPDREFNRFWSWCTAIGGELLVLDSHAVYRNRRVCHSHFKEKYRTRSKLLSDYAIPTLLVSGLSVENREAVKDITRSTTAEVEAPPSLSSEDCSQTPKQAEVSCTSDSEPFSWNKECVNVPDTGEVENGRKLFDDTEHVCEDVQQKSSQSIDEQFENDMRIIPYPPVHEGFTCNVCEKVITGFRYTCLQCVDYDMCSSCEHRSAHASHYVLRVPWPVSYEEIQTMLETIRRQLFHYNIVLDNNLGRDADSLKLEVKEELEEVNPLENEIEQINEPTASVQSDSGEDLVKEENLVKQEAMPSNVKFRNTYKFYQSHKAAGRKKPSHKIILDDNTEYVTEENLVKLEAMPSNVKFRNTNKFYQSHKAAGRKKSSHQIIFDDNTEYVTEEHLVEQEALQSNVKLRSTNKLCQSHKAAGRRKSQHQIILEDNTECVTEQVLGESRNNLQSPNSAVKISQTQDTYAVLSRTSQHPSILNIMSGPSISSIKRKKSRCDLETDDVDQDKRRKGEVVNTSRPERKLVKIPRKMLVKVENRKGPQFVLLKQNKEKILQSNKR